MLFKSQEMNVPKYIYRACNAGYAAHITSYSTYLHACGPPSENIPVSCGELHRPHRYSYHSLAHPGN